MSETQTDEHAAVPPTIRDVINQAISNMVAICNLTDDPFIDEIATRTANELSEAITATT